jgi:hypothetical protein
MEGHAKSGPIPRLPLVTISELSNLLRDVLVCQVIVRIIFSFSIVSFHSKQPIHFLIPAIPSGLNFFNQENRVVQYPVRAIFLDGFNLMAHNLSSGADNLYKKLYSTVLTLVEQHFLFI